MKIGASVAENGPEFAVFFKFDNEVKQKYINAKHKNGITNERRNRLKSL